MSAAREGHQRNGRKKSSLDNKPPARRLAAVGESSRIVRNLPLGTKTVL
jgi:hypothetical protein